LKVSPVVLTVVAGLANATMNIIPWGGPTVRAASALGLSPSEVFVPRIPSLVVGLVVVLGFAAHLGFVARRRLGKLTWKPDLMPLGAGPSGVGTTIGKDTDEAGEVGQLAA